MSDRQRNTRNDRERLADILRAARHVLDFTEGIEQGQLDDDPMRQFALAGALATIGEAAAHISKETKAQRPWIPWPRITGMRHRLIHAYWQTDTERLLDVARNHIPELITNLERDPILRNPSDPGLGTTTQTALRLSPDSPQPASGPADVDIERLYHDHPDQIPTLAGTGDGTVLFGLSTTDKAVTVLYAVAEGKEADFIDWMKEHRHLWGDPFGDPDDADGGVGHQIAKNRERGRTREPGTN